MASDTTPVLVAGAGSWGTALAIVLTRNHQPTYLWGRNRETMAALKRDRTNKRYLPGYDFQDLLEPVDDLAAVLSGVNDIVIAVPCQGLRSVLELIARASHAEIRICMACKGLEAGTQLLNHEVAGEVLGEEVPTAVLSGPSFAVEVAKDLPTAVTVASSDATFASDLARRFHSESFRTYTNDDIIGVEVGGAVKNVLAIAAGIADGLGFGANTRTALITRGLAEIIRLGMALGGKRETLMGLAGLGDLVLTATEDQSRNRRFGLALAKGATVEQALAQIGQVVEGVQAAYEVDTLAQKLGIEMPITHQVVRVLSGESTPREAVQALLARDPKAETL